MKLSPALLVFSLIVGCVGTTLPQNQMKARRGIILSLAVDDPSSDAYFIPINTNKAGSRNNGGGGVAKHNGPDDTGPRLPPGYSYEWKVSVVDNRRSRIRLWIHVDDGSHTADGFAGECKTYKEFFVYRNRRTVITMGCKVKLIASYGAEPSESVGSTANL